MSKIIILCTLLCLFNLSLGAQYPAELSRCKVGDEKCIATTATEVLRTVANSENGYPGLSLPTIEPLHINEIKIKQGSQSPVNIELNFADIDLHGLKLAEFTKTIGFNKDPNGKFEIQVKMPKLFFQSKYTINGRVLVLPIQGVGEANITIDNPLFFIKFLGKSETKNGKDYLKIDKFKFMFTTTKIHMVFGNLYNGDKVLGDNTNLFLNENWQDIFNELKENLFDAFGQVIKSLLNNVFSRIPYKDLFTDE